LRRRLPRFSLLSAPLALLLVIQAASVLAMPDRRLGIEPLLDLLASIAIFTALVDCPGLSARSIARSLMLMATAAGAACLWYVWLRWLDWRALTLAVPDAHAGLLPPTVPRVLAVGTNPHIIAPAS